MEDRRKRPQSPRAGRTAGRARPDGAGDPFSWRVRHRGEIAPRQASRWPMHSRPEIDQQGARRAGTIADEAARWLWADQAAWYQDAVLHTPHQTDWLPFIFGVIQSEEPYECRSIDLQQRWIDRARNRNERTVQNIRRAIDTNDWGQDYADKIVTLAEPGWSQNEAQWEPVE